MKVKFYSLLFLFVFSVTFLQATTYYIAPADQGGSDLNTGSFALPFLTLKKALGKSDMTTIIVRGGTYYITGDSTVSISKIGTSPGYYTLINYPGEVPVFNCSGLNAAKKGFTLSGSYWYIKGINIKLAKDNGMYITGSNNVVEFCTFSENMDTGLQLSGGAANNKIINCDSYFNKDATSENADGFACKLDVGSGNSFKGCRAWQNADDGWDGYLRGSDNIVTTLDSCWSFRNGYLKTGATSGANGDGNGFKMGGSDLTDLSHHMTLTHCLSFNNRKRGFDQNNNRGNMTLYNNTAYGNGSGNYIMNSIALASGNVMTIKNCVAYKIDGTAGSNAFQDGAVLQNNSWQTPFVVTDADFISKDSVGARAARKANGSLPDITFMHLASGSDLIDGGQNVGLVFNGSAPDLGAFETVGTTPVTMLSFMAVNDKNGVHLNWKMASEFSNKGWSVERSAGNNLWNELGFVEGAVNSSIITNYFFTDNNLAEGIYYYRLKQIDLDGKISYSKTLTVKISGSKKGLETISYPNPCKTSLTVVFTVPKKGKVNLQMFDINGISVQSVVNEELREGTYQKLINTEKLSAGNYFLKITTGGETRTSSIVCTK